MNKAVIVTGPTATGKSLAAVEIALRFKGEIINADSMQVYQGMDIGTAKPSPSEMQKVPHHLFDICSIEERFSAGKYASLASETIMDIVGRGKLPVIAGGTGLYTRALIKGFFQEPAIDISLENSLAKTEEKMGLGYLYTLLKKVDKPFAESINQHDKQRISRGLTFYFSTGTPLSNMWEKTHPILPDIEYITIGLTADRDILYQAINQRVDIMVNSGLLDEVKTLLKNASDRNLHCFKAIGYREILAFLDGSITFEDAVNEIKKNTRRFAKRQLTWFKDEKIRWFKGNPIESKIPVEEILNYIKLCI